MKNKLLILPIFLGPLVVTSCNVLNPSAPSSPQEKPENLKLSFPDYFAKYDNNAYSERNKIKEKITLVINKYRLKEWNQYYENKNLSNVLNINLSDYNTKAEGSQDFDWIDVGSTSYIATKKYNNQEKQFQYINDFINLINEENTSNQEDFLYLRWLYYSLFGANLYQMKVGIPFEKNTEKKLLIKDVNIVDWINSVSKIVLEANPKDLFELIYSFLTYYGIVPDIGKMENYFKDLEKELKKPGEILKNLSKEFEKVKKEISNKLYPNFLEDLNKLYKDIANEYKKIYNKELSFLDFIKDIKKFTDEFKEISKEYEQTIKNWIDFNEKEILLEFIEAFKKGLENSIPNINPPDFLLDVNFGLQNSVLHAKLCAQDMLMRLLSKRDVNDKYYQVWEAKKQRAFEIYKKMNYYNNLLTRSFLVKKDELPEKIIESLTKILGNSSLDKFIKDFMKKILDNVLTNLVSIIFSSIEKMMNTLLDNTIGQLRLVYIKLDSYTTNKLEVI